MIVPTSIDPSSHLQGTSLGFGEAGGTLPKSISPCPIRDAVAEVRFETNVPPDAVFGICYQILRGKFPKVEALPILSLPPQVRSDRDLEFQPHYRLLNETTVALVGPKVISVGMRGDYPGWAVHSQRINDTLTSFHQSGIVTKSLRLGLRYISFFGFDIYPNLRLRINAEEESLGGDETFFKTVLSAGSYRILLQIGKGLALVGVPSEIGSVIDIDCFSTQMEGEFVLALNRFLEEAHQVEKSLFFRLLRPEFLSSLNPVYADGN